MVHEKKTRIAFEINTAQVQKAELSFRALGDALDDLARKKTKISHPSVEKFRKNATRKMTNMVMAFAVNIYENAVLNTPIGDSGRINKKTDPEYWRMYYRRMQDHGIAMTPGYHKGAWQYSETKIPSFDSNIKGISEARSEFIKTFKSSYKLGDTFYVGAKGPGFAPMEKGYVKSAPDGVYQPTVQAIMQTYAFDLEAALKRR